MWREAGSQKPSETQSKIQSQKEPYCGPHATGGGRLKVFEFSDRRSSVLVIRTGDHVVDGLFDFDGEVRPSFWTLTKRTNWHHSGDTVPRDSSTAN